MTSQEKSQTVCAVILTFDSLSRVQKCLSAVLKQTRLPDTVLVVDNHSRDGTQEYLESLGESVPSLMVVRTSENLGPAGGFHTGMSVAFDHGYEYLWLLDDDSVPEQLCLEKLLHKLGTAKDVIAWPINIDETGRQTNHPAWRGELLPRQVVEQGGLPNKELFWGVEDTEYFIGRLYGKHHIGSIKVQDAVVHYTQANARKNATWHYYYRPRNMVYYRLWIQDPPRVRKLLARLIKLWGRMILKEKSKTRKTIYMVWGVWHGLRRRIGKTIDPARSK